MAKKALLPKKGTPEWDIEVSFYLSSDRSARVNRTRELGFSSVNSYMTAMFSRGISLLVPTSGRGKLNKPITIRKPSLIIFDTQVPFHDAEFLNNLLGLAMSWGIKQGISGGDFLNMTAFSMFFENPEDKIWSRERNSAIQVIEAMHSSIPNWFLVKGNHEDFLLKRLAEQIGHEEILALLDKREGVTSGFSATDYYYCKVQLGGSTWRITHPRNVSVIHGRIPQALCNKYHCNIASGHGHLAGMTPDYSGRYVACDVGVTCDPERLDYVSLRDTTRPAQCRGALILMLGNDGKCYPYHIYPNADWSALRRLYNA